MEDFAEDKEESSETPMSFDILLKLEGLCEASN
jgi:hypothetical protein